MNLFERAAAETDSDVGLWKAGGTLSLADVMAGPCTSRLCISRVRCTY